MKLSKAKELLEEHNRSYKPGYEGDFGNAIKLSIEALKRVKWHKEQHLDGYYELLPGETKD